MHGCLENSYTKKANKFLGTHRIPSFARVVESNVYKTAEKILYIWICVRNYWPVPSSSRNLALCNALL